MGERKETGENVGRSYGEEIDWEEEKREHGGSG